MSAVRVAYTYCETRKDDERMSGGGHSGRCARARGGLRAPAPRPAPTPGGADSCSGNPRPSVRIFCGGDSHGRPFEADPGFTRFVSVLGVRAGPRGAGVRALPLPACGCPVAGAAGARTCPWRGVSIPGGTCFPVSHRGTPPAPRLAPRPGGAGAGRLHRALSPLEPCGPARLSPPCASVSSSPGWD